MVFLTGDDHRNLKSTEMKNLEYVRITHTGGKEIEKAANSRGIAWGACHFIEVEAEGCKRPDYRWYKQPVKPNFILTNVWQTPPKYLKTTIPDQNNPYTNRDLFTVVRNPYARYVSEFYCKFNGFQHSGGSEDAGTLNSWIKNHINQLQSSKVDYMESLKNGDAPTSIEVPELLAIKSFVPQVEYVYDDDGSRIVKNVLRYEDLRTEFKQLMKEYGYDIQLPYSIQESKGSLTYKDLSPETIALINEYARADFYAFGYEMVKDIKSSSKYSIRSKSMPCRVFKASDPESEKCEVDERKSSQTKPSSRSRASNNVAIGRPHATTMLLGIFTDNTLEQVDARQRMRDTYLHTQSWPLVCTLAEYKRQFDVSSGLWVPCRLPYVFVIGGDPNRPGQHRDRSPLTIERALMGNATSEDDMVYLNIVDSTHHGKSISYFKWVSSFGDEYSIDFAAKVDSGTLLERQKLVTFMDMELPPTPMNRRMYGGGAWGHRGSFFATNPFYFMSMDLATFIGTSRINEWNSESQDIGSHIFYHPKPVKFVNMNPRMFWFEDLNTHQEWFRHWNNRMTELPRSASNMPVIDICKNLKDEGNLWK